MPQRTLLSARAKKVTAVHIIDDKTEKVEKVKPEPRASGHGVFFEIEVEVQEVLYPSFWKPTKTIKVHYYGGIFNVKEVRENLTRNYYIYLLTDEPPKENPFFQASYGWDLVEEIKKKETFWKSGSSTQFRRFRQIGRKSVFVKSIF